VSDILKLPIEKLMGEAGEIKQDPWLQVERSLSNIGISIRITCTREFSLMEQGLGIELGFQAAPIYLCFLSLNHLFGLCIGLGGLYWKPCPWRITSLPLNWPMPSIGQICAYNPVRTTTNQLSA
jgi:hypothetical protein